ncbi:unnamed protein product [Clonostachys chloroleuca]|uniref:Uncharacterized protein n=1 Tax=Clonostachys chloroleuca TaxID=1926264 RepID=A0AA35MD54_9HYPO|nr:unnamed protein product [Clonostachys chloroleuca]
MLFKTVILYTLSVAVAASPVLQERDDVTWYRPDPAVFICKNLNAWDESTATAITTVMNN